MALYMLRGRANGWWLPAVATPATEVKLTEISAGLEFDAVISGVTSFGLFVELVECLISGAVPVKDMKDDWYRHEYAPRYQERHGHRKHDRDYRDGYRDGRRDGNRHDDRGGRGGRGDRDDRGPGHGQGRGRD